MRTASSGPGLEPAFLNAAWSEPELESPAGLSAAWSEPKLESPAGLSAAWSEPELESPAGLSAAWSEPELESPAARALARALGGIGADGVIVAWEGGGRIAHVYVDGATDSAALVEASAGCGAVIERGYDPTLAEVRHLTGLRASVQG